MRIWPLQGDRQSRVSTEYCKNVTISRIRYALSLSIWKLNFFSMKFDVCMHLLQKKKGAHIREQIDLSRVVIQLSHMMLLSSGHIKSILRWFLRCDSFPRTAAVLSFWSNLVVTLTAKSSTFDCNRFHDSGRRINWFTLRNIAILSTVNIGAYKHFFRKNCGFSVPIV